MQHNPSSMPVTQNPGERETRGYVPRPNGTSLNLSPLAIQVLSFDEIVSLRSRTEIAVRPEYTFDAVNDINRAYYGLPSNTAFLNSGLAPYFVEIPSVQHALSHAIESHLPNRVRRPIKLVEIAAGLRNRWRLWSETRRRYDVTLTDFSPHILPDSAHQEVGENISLRTGVYNLYEPLQLTHTDGGQFDVLLATYAFDSVWLPGDRRYVKAKNGEWCEAVYRVVVPEYLEPAEKLALLVALRTGVWENTNGMSLLGLLKKVEIQERLLPVDMQEVPFGPQIVQMYGRLETVEVNVPGGLVQRVQEAFHTSLSAGGIFIIGDVAINHGECYTQAENGSWSQTFISGHNTSGEVAKYRVADFGLAKHILEAEGFRVTIYDATEYAMRFANGDLEQRRQLHGITNQYIMVVSR